jgi:hypothetical protein
VDRTQRAVVAPGYSRSIALEAPNVGAGHVRVTQRTSRQARLPPGLNPWCWRQGVPLRRPPAALDPDDPSKGINPDPQKPGSPEYSMTRRRASSTVRNIGVGRQDHAVAAAHWQLCVRPRRGRSGV